MKFLLIAIIWWRSILDKVGPFYLKAFYIVPPVAFIYLLLYIILFHTFTNLCVGVQHEELCKLAEKHFGGMTAGYEGEIPVLPECRFTGCDVSLLLLPLQLQLGDHYFLIIKIR